MKKLLKPHWMFCMGLILGIISRLLDIYTLYSKSREYIFPDGNMDINGNINFNL